METLLRHILVIQVNSKFSKHGGKRAAERLVGSKQLQVNAPRKLIDDAHSTA